MYLDEGDSPYEMISADRQAEFEWQNPTTKDSDAFAPEELEAGAAQSGSGSRSELDRLRRKGQALLATLEPTEAAKINEQVKALRSEAKQRKDDYRRQVENPNQPTMPVRVVTGEPAGSLRGRLSTL